MNTNRTPGFWAIMVLSIIWLIFLVLGQVMSFINYDFAVSLGLQEAREIVSDMGVAVNKGFGVADTIVYIPLLVIGLVGMWLKKKWGLFAMAGAFGITAYFPVVCLFLLFFSRSAPGFHFTRFTSYTVILTLVAVYGLWGLWYLYTRRDILTSKEE